MPNNKQAKKRNVQDEQRRLRNKAVKSSMRSAVKEVLTADTADAANGILPVAMKRIDKAAKANIIHDNTAARYKARMSRSIKAKG